MPDQTPAVLDIHRSRGDTFSFDIDLTLNGVASDISGAAFKLTVDPSPAPADATANLFTNVPLIEGVATAGRIRITLLTAEAAIAPKTYFYDIQQTIGASIRTVVKGKWVVEQDVTK